MATSRRLFRIKAPSQLIHRLLNTSVQFYMLILNWKLYIKKQSPTGFPRNIFLELSRRNFREITNCIYDIHGDCFKSVISWKINFECLINKNDKENAKKIHIPYENIWDKIIVICKTFMLYLPCITRFKISIFVKSFPGDLFCWNDLLCWIYFPP